MSATAERSIARTFRFTPDELAGIDTRAQQHRLNRTEYMIRASLGELGPTLTIDERLDALEEAVQRLERLQDFAG